MNWTQPTDEENPSHPIKHWIDMEIALEDWQELGSNQKLIDELEFAIWNFDERHIISKLRTDKALRQLLWVCFEDLAAVAINQGLQRLATLTIFVKSILFVSSKSYERSTQVNRKFWELFTFCYVDQSLQFDPQASSITIGYSQLFSFNLSMISDRELQSKIEKRFQAFQRSSTASPTQVTRDNSGIVQVVTIINAPVDGNSSNQTSADIQISSDNAQVSSTLFEYAKRKLDNCKPGNASSREFEQIGSEIFHKLFSPQLGQPHEQERTQDGSIIRDGIFPIEQRTGVWDTVSYKYNSIAVIVDYKNYTDEIGTDEVSQMERYTNEAIGNFGIIWARNGYNTGAHTTRIRAASHNKKLILIFSDEQFLEMCKLKDQNQSPGSYIMKEMVRVLSLV